MITTKPMVPRHLYKLLDYTTAALFMGDGFMRPFIIKTYQEGIQHVGSLVQMSEDEVFRRAPTSLKNRDKIRKELEEEGLTFGMLAPEWKKPNPNRSEPNP